MMGYLTPARIDREFVFQRIGRFCRTLGLTTGAMGRPGCVCCRSPRPGSNPAAAVVASPYVWIPHILAGHRQDTAPDRSNSGSIPIARATWSSCSDVGQRVSTDGRRSSATTSRDDPGTLTVNRKKIAASDLTEFDAAE
jgi:hypothetical protein